jgi:acyl carrier protein
MTSLDYQQVETQIIYWIRDISGFESEISPEDNFIKSGWLDSFAVLGLIMQIEQNYGFKFEMQELANPELQTIKNMANVVFAKVQKTP